MTACCIACASLYSPLSYTKRLQNQKMNNQASPCNQSKTRPVMRVSVRRNSFLGSSRLGSSLHP